MRAALRPQALASLYAPAVRRSPLLLLTLLCACASDPPPPPPRAPVLDRTTVRALREWALASYALRRLAEPGMPRPGESRVTEMEAELDEARTDLSRALIAAGADPARANDGDQFLSLAHEAARAGGRYDFLLGDDPASFALVRLERVEPARAVTLFGERFQYRLIVHDETLVPDYPTWRAEQAGAPLLRPVTWSGDGTIRIDRAAIERLGAEQFLPRVAEHRAAAQRAAEPGAFAPGEGEAALPGLLEQARAALRWRSLEQLWSNLASRPREEQLQGFAADYAARAELRAACELFEHGRAPPPPPDGTPDPVRLQELGALSAMIHGEPLGVAADLVALAIRALARTADPSTAPALLAARRLTGDLAASFRRGPPSPEVDAQALRALSQATPDGLREVARELHAARLKSH